MYFKEKIASDKCQVGLVGGKEATKVSQLSGLGKAKKEWISYISLLLLKKTPPPRQNK